MCTAALTQFESDIYCVNGKGARLALRGICTGASSHMHMMCVAQSPHLPGRFFQADSVGNRVLVAMADTVGLAGVSLLSTRGANLD